MTALLAKFFRGLHMFLGITPPPPSYDERRFVLIWLGMILLVVVMGVAMFWLIAKAYKS